MQAQGPGYGRPARVSEEMKKGREVMTEAEWRLERIAMASELSLSLGGRKDTNNAGKMKECVQESERVERRRDDSEARGKRKLWEEAMADVVTAEERKFVARMRMNDRLATAAAPRAAWVSSHASRGVVESHQDTRPKTVAEESFIVGEWEIEIPDEEHANADGEDYYISVYRSPTGHLDAVFHMPPIKGTLRFSKKKPTTKDRTLKFKWRGQKTMGEKEIHIGEGGVDYMGTISLVGLDQLEGFYEGPCGTIKFEGHKVSGSPLHTGMAWDSFTGETQQKEQSMRWL